MAKAKATSTKSYASTSKASAEQPSTKSSAQSSAQAKEIAALKSEVARLTADNQTLQLMVGKSFQS